MLFNFIGVPDLSMSLFGNGKRLNQEFNGPLRRCSRRRLVDQSVKVNVHHGFTDTTGYSPRQVWSFYQPPSALHRLCI